jgi:hypothetical protein
MSNPKLLVIGHARHGKDTVCELLRDYYGYSFVSSSEFVGRECIWDLMKPFYSSFEEMYEDRSNHRELWANLISYYNMNDKSRTASGMLAQGKDIYCGMRRRDEYEAAAQLFDHVIWVDRSDYLPPEPKSSMELDELDANITIDNNGSLQDLAVQVSAVMKYVDNTA